LLKQLPSSIHFQNVCAYTWGAFFNLTFIYLHTDDRERVAQNGFFGGYNTWTWLYVLFHALMGLSVSFMYKYQDNIARLMTIAASMSATLFISVPALGQLLSISSVAAVFIICIALVQYYDGAEQQAEVDLALDAAASTDRTPKEGTTLLPKDAPSKPSTSLLSWPFSSSS